MCLLHRVIFFLIVSAMDISAGEDGTSTKADQLKSNNENFVMFLMIGVISGTFAWIYTSLFKITGYRQGAVSLQLILEFRFLVLTYD
jgi:hypothetical protein